MHAFSRILAPSPRLAIALIFLIRGFLLGNWFPRIPGIAERLEITSSQLGLAWFFTATGCIAAFAVAARIMRRVGSRRAILLFAIPYPLAFILIGLAPSPLMFGLGMVLFGFLNGGYEVGLSVQGGVVERATRRPIMSTLFGWFSLGTLLGSFGSGLIAEAGIPVSAQYAGLSALAIPAVVSLLRHVVDDLPVAPAPAPASLARAFRLPPRALWPLGAMIILVALSEESINNWVALYLRQDLGAAPAVAGFAYTAFAITTTIGRLLGDQIIARAGIDDTLRGGSLLAAAGIAFAVLVNAPWAFLAGYALVGAGMSVIVPVTYRRAGDLPGIAPAVAVSGVAMIGYLGFMAGPILIGVIADLLSLRVALGLVGASMLGISGIVALQGRAERQQADEAPASARHATA